MSKQVYNKITISGPAAEVNMATESKQNGVARILRNEKAEALFIEEQGINTTAAFEVRSTGDLSNLIAALQNAHQKVHVSHFYINFNNDTFGRSQYGGKEHHEAWVGASGILNMTELKNNVSLADIRSIERSVDQVFDAAIGSLENNETAPGPRNAPQMAGPRPPH